MKKIFFSLLASAFLIAANAQMRQGNTITERTKFGIKGGLSSSFWQEEQYGSGYAIYDTKFGAVAGVEAEIPIRNGWYLQPEANYANMGAQGYETITNDQTKQNENTLVKYKNDYIQVPVLAKYRTLFSGFAFYFGPQASFLLQAKNKPVNYEPLDVKEDFTKMDFSGVVGAEYYMPTFDDRKPRFGISARYVHGFTNIYPEGSQLAQNYSLKNRGFQLTLGVRF